MTSSPTEPELQLEPVAATPVVTLAVAPGPLENIARRKIKKRSALSRICTRSRFIAIASGIVFLIAVVLASLLPTMLLWQKSLDDITSTSKTTIDTQMKLYRTSIVSKSVDAIAERANKALPSIYSLAQYFTPHLATIIEGNGTCKDNLQTIQNIFIPARMAMDSSLSGIDLDWVNDAGQHSYMEKQFPTGQPQWVVMDSNMSSGKIDASLVSYWYANWTVPTKNYSSTGAAFKLMERDWFAAGVASTVPAGGLIWTPPFMASVKGVGMIISVSARLPTKALAMVKASFSIAGFVSYMGALNHSQHGWAMLVEGSSLNLIAASPGIYVPSTGPQGSAHLLSAFISPNLTVAEVAASWNASTAADKAAETFGFTIEGGTVLVDVKTVSLTGSGLLLRLFMVTPKADWYSQIDTALDDAQGTAGDSLMIAILIELGVLLFSFILVLLFKLKGRDSIEELRIKSDEIEILAEIGKGKLGKVFLANWRGSDACVRVINLIGEDGEQSFDKLKQDVKKMRKLRHPNVVMIYGFFERVNEFCLVTEYMPMGSLERLLLTSDSLDLSSVLSIANDVIKGLAFLHSCKPAIVHGAVFSSNVMLDAKLGAKLADCGFTVYAAKSRQQGNTRLVAPELSSSSSAVTQAVDVFAFGVLLWEMCLSKEKFTQYISKVRTDSSSLASLPYISKDSVTSLELPDRAPVEILKLIKSCTSQDPTLRPASSLILDQWPTLSMELAGLSLTGTPALTSIPPPMTPLNSAYIIRVLVSVRKESFLTPLVSELTSFYALGYT